jgi:hypothetical protein
MNLIHELRRVATGVGARASDQDLLLIAASEISRLQAILNSALGVMDELSDGPSVSSNEQSDAVMETVRRVRALLTDARS